MAGLARLLGVELVVHALFDLAAVLLHSGLVERRRRRQDRHHLIRRLQAPPKAATRLNFRRSVLSCIDADFCDQILIFRDLKDFHTFSPLETQNRGAHY